MHISLPSIILRRSDMRKRFRDALFLLNRSEKVPIGITRKLRMWKNGFLSESYLIYDFDNNDLKDYLSDHVRLELLTKINGYYCVALYDKLYFSLLLKKYDQYFPETYGLINARRVAMPGQARSAGLERIIDLCHEKGPLVLKPITGGQGRGVMMVEASNGRLLINKKQISNNELLSIAGDLNDYLVDEFITQHPYASAIFPHTCNTL